MNMLNLFHKHKITVPLQNSPIYQDELLKKLEKKLKNIFKKNKYFCVMKDQGYVFVSHNKQTICKLLVENGHIHMQQFLVYIEDVSITEEIKLITDIVNELNKS